MREITPHLIREEVDYIKFVRDDYSDEMPDPIVHGDDENNMHKVRSAWWTQINTIISSLEFYYLVDAKLIEKGDKIVEHRNMNNHLTGLTFKEDIAAANLYLTELAETLEAKL